MRKATGKVVSLVLALALVVTSFSSTFALAATKSEFTDDVHAKDDTVYLANLSNYADSNGELQQANAGGAHQVGQIDLEYHGDRTQAKTGGSQQHGRLKDGTATRQDNTPLQISVYGGLTAV